MLDPKLLRNDLDTVSRQLARRGFTLDTGTLQGLEERRKAIQVETQTLQAERNSRSKGIGKAKAAVFPVPVCAPAMRSRPSSTRGIACAWTGVGSL